MKNRTIRKRLIRYKVYIDRARMYYGYVQFVMIGVLFINSFQKNGWVSQHPTIAVGVGLVAFFVGSGLLGWVDKRLGLIQEEYDRHAKLNPTYQEMIAKLDILISNQNSKSRSDLYTEQDMLKMMDILLRDINGNVKSISPTFIRTFFEEHKSKLKNMT